MTFETFSADEKTIDAVVRNLMIIGEAAAHVPRDVQEQYPQVPWVEMRGMRNIVAHEYFRVGLPIVWRTIRQNLPPAALMMREILKQQP